MAIKGLFLSVLMSGLASIASFAQDMPGMPMPTADHHKHHYMIIEGTQDVFAYHYVYKVPHNYQVILKLRFDPTVQASYLAERSAHPDDTFYFYLDPMEIAKVADVTSLTGTLVREPKGGAEVVFLNAVTVPRASFDVLFFEEVQTDLSGT